MDLPWTAPVPPGEVRTEVNPPTLKVKLYSWAFVTTFIAGTTVGLRIFTRFYVTRTPLNTDDYLVVISLLFAISTIVVLFQQVEVGLAHHMWDILWDVYNVHNTGWTIAATIVYALSISFSKLSILFLYLRLSPQVWFRRGVFFLIGLVVSYSIVYVFINIFGCTPIRAGWDLSIVEKTCVDKFSIYLSLSIANIAMDVLILLLPIPVVVPLQMARRQKFSIILLFGTGVFVCGVATKRTVHLPKLLASPDYTWEAVEAFIWGYLELNAGMICVSVPALKPFFMRYLPSFITSRLGSSKRGGSSLNKSSKSRLNTVVAQNMERRRRQDESYELSSTDGKRDGIEDDETKLWSGYQKNAKAALGCHARETSRQVDDNSNSSVDTLGEMTGPRRGDRTVVVSAESSAPGVASATAKASATTSTHAATVAPMSFRSLWARARGSFLGDTAIRLAGIATWIPVVIWFNDHVATVTKISGASMYPYFNEDRNSTIIRDLVLNWRWHANEDLRRGMIVTFRSPFHPETVAVKRIIALEGDHVKTRPPHPQPMVRVPQGHIWVEGDGPADQTLDSNTYGPISMELVTGKIVWFLYPFRKFGRTKWEDFKMKPRE